MNGGDVTAQHYMGRDVGAVMFQRQGLYAGADTFPNFFGEFRMGIGQDDGKFLTAIAGNEI